MKPPKIIIGGNIAIEVHDSDGVEIIKGALQKAEAISKDEVAIKYNGGGAYNISVTGKDYKQAEKTLKQCIDTITEIINKKEGKSEFKRVEKN
jgi:translation initiation factor 2 alpha subunit (eIF-2alpha)